MIQKIPTIPREMVMSPRLPTLRGRGKQGGNNLVGCTTRLAIGTIVFCDTWGRRVGLDIIPTLSTWSLET
jgi:hypothetical protein